MSLFHSEYSYVISKTFGKSIMSHRMTQLWTSSQRIGSGWLGLNSVTVPLTVCRSQWPIVFHHLIDQALVISSLIPFYITRRHPISTCKSPLCADSEEKALIQIIKEKQIWICQTVYRCTVADESHRVTYHPGKSRPQSSCSCYPPPPKKQKSHHISIWPMSLWKYPVTLYLMCSMSIWKANTADTWEAWTSFSGVPSDTEDFTLGALHFHSLTLPQSNICTREPLTRQNVAISPEYINQYSWSQFKGAFQMYFTFVFSNVDKHFPCSCDILG